MEVNSTFHLDWDGERGAHAQMKIRRLHQSKSVAYAVWVDVPNHSINGFPVQARVLAGAPPSTTDAVLNVRLER